jgi:hypothetical protein
MLRLAKEYTSRMQQQAYLVDWAFYLFSIAFRRHFHRSLNEFPDHVHCDQTNVVAEVYLHNATVSASIDCEYLVNALTLHDPYHSRLPLHICCNKLELCTVALGQFQSSLDHDASFYGQVIEHVMLLLQKEKKMIGKRNKKYGKIMMRTDGKIRL